MTPNVTDYVAAGYFLSRYAAAQDCTGLQLRRISMGHDHSQRRFFPETWTLSWCRETREQRFKKAAVSGLSEKQLDKVIACSRWALVGHRDCPRCSEVGARSAQRQPKDRNSIPGASTHRSGARTARERKAVETLLEAMNTLPFGEEEARVAAVIRQARPDA